MLLLLMLCLAHKIPDRLDAEDYDPRDGDESFYEGTSNYMSLRATAQGWISKWGEVRAELAHRRRFFSESARAHFGEVFADITDLKAFDEGERRWDPVVYELPKGQHLHRARTVRSDAELRSFLAEPSKELGAPPSEKAPAGRMNPQGIAVFYASLDADTCLAEMRPPIGGRSLVGTFAGSQALRVLDFRRLEIARAKSLSYFDSQYRRQRDRAVFLRHLHGLISRPVVPGREDDYLITQTMAEYLAHVHNPSFDGVIFGSVQRRGGANVVLFGRDNSPLIADLDEPPGRNGLFVPSAQPNSEPDLVFPVDYVGQSAKLYQTGGIHYSHSELHYRQDEGRVHVHDYVDEEDFEEGW